MALQIPANRVVMVSCRAFCCIVPSATAFDERCKQSSARHCVWL